MRLTFVFIPPYQISQLSIPRSSFCAQKLERGNQLSIISSLPLARKNWGKEISSSTQIASL
ncbi:MAG: hypothetical protein DRR00_17660 [Candidatus Parabeggiatoa sp. nov. 3]|jgi:hypothetical protein|nr:MAG: hypothetical protein DRR00_17660 [Gammaproteobacteria bacterium]